MRRAIIFSLAVFCCVVAFSILTDAQGKPRQAPPFKEKVRKSIPEVMAAAEFPDSTTAREDTRAASLMDADHFVLRLPAVQSRSQWEIRKKHLREMVLLRAGLWPEPPRTPLNATVFGEMKGEGFTVSKVYFESLPGCFATGNLYRPTRGRAPYPAVVTPHGHWPQGRLVNTADCSIPGRCIDFARMGFVVFAIDMAGYNDSMQFPHVSYMNTIPMKADVPQPVDRRTFTADFSFPDAELYGFSLGGLQLWNGIRAVDFLCSLPEVDKNRIGVTGASGGATQTILLMTADDRIRVAAPVNIIGAAKHPGCRCENIPGLWLETTTIELAAAFAPKPLLLMSATEDPWTNKTPERELPIIKKYYDLLGAGDKIKNVHITAGHNYNADTRAAVYEWFCAHLKSEFPPIKSPVPVAPEVKNLGDLRAFPDRLLPENALSAWQIMDNWKKMSEQAFASLLPKSKADWNRFAGTFREKLAVILGVEVPDVTEIAFRVRQSDSQGRIRYEWPTPGDRRQESGSPTLVSVRLSRKGKGDSVALEVLSLGGNPPRGCILLVAPETGESSESLVNDWSGQGYRVYRVHGYASGEYRIPKKTWDSFRWSPAYNRDNTMNAVQDIVTAIAYIKGDRPGIPLNVVGLGECGLPAALACAVTGLADDVVVDLAGSDPSYDGEMLSRTPWGAFKRIGDFRTAALLLMDKPLTILNAGETFDREWYRKMAKMMGMEGKVKVE
jgi:dienelactone hydrolase